MPCVCRLFQLSSERANTLVQKPEHLSTSMESAQSYTDVYRYWDAIQYLLFRHQPALNWLTVGAIVSESQEGIPAARLIFPDQVRPIDLALRDIEPEDLVPYYEAEQLDRAGVYPQCWSNWEETFDPLGQVLEHYWFLKQFVASCAASENALLLYFEFDEDGSDP